jgi:hypothetical protein
MEQLSNEFKAKQFADLKNNRTSYAWSVAYERYLAALITEQNFCKPDVSGSLELLRQLLNREQDLRDRTGNGSVKTGTSQNIDAIGRVIQLIIDTKANDR